MTKIEYEQKNENMEVKKGKYEMKLQKQNSID